MDILKVISLLLDYPQQVVMDAGQELVDAIEQCRLVSPEQRRTLLAAVRELTAMDLMDAQECYLGLFNRGRYLSLLLFEHVHGESRDRGQAMVDLLAQYEADGFAIQSRELPDYIPLYLEYLSTREQLVARAGLADVQHLLALLAARLEEQGSSYAACFQVLLQLAGSDPAEAVAQVRELVADEPCDTSLEALDAEWEEEAVTFMSGDATHCGLNPAAGGHKVREETAVPLHWVGFDPARQPANKL